MNSTSLFCTAVRQHCNGPFLRIYSILRFWSILTLIQPFSFPLPSRVLYLRVWTYNSLKSNQGIYEDSLKLVQLFSEILTYAQTKSYYSIVDVLLNNVVPGLEPVQHVDVGNCHHWHDMGLHQVEVSIIILKWIG